MGEVRRKGISGFTLVELALLVVVIGVLAAFAVPKYLASEERTRAAEAFAYLEAVQDAQDRYYARQATYAQRLEDLDVELPDLRFFETGGIDASDPKAIRNAWSQTLTRREPSAGFGRYTVVFNQDGFDSEKSTIGDLPGIDPRRTDID